MPNFHRAEPQTGGAAIADENWHIEIYAHPHQGVTLEIRMAATGVPTAIADITKDRQGIQIGPWRYGELQRLPPTAILDEALQFAKETVI